jgi:hypothetical protein
MSCLRQRAAEGRSAARPNRRSGLLYEKAFGKADDDLLYGGEAIPSPVKNAESVDFARDVVARQVFVFAR